MKQGTSVIEAMEESVLDLFDARVEAVYEMYRDLPKAQELIEKIVSIEQEIVKLDKVLYYRLEEAWNELNYFYDELIYRQGVIDSDRFYKVFKSLGLVYKKEVSLSIMEHERFSEVWNAKANAYNEVSRILLENGLENELEKLSILEEKQGELRGVYEEVAYDNGVLDGIAEIERILKKYITFTKKEEVK